MPEDGGETAKVLNVACIATEQTVVAQSQRSPGLLSAAPSVDFGSRCQRDRTDRPRSRSRLIDLDRRKVGDRDIEVLGGQKLCELGQLGHQEFAVLIAAVAGDDDVAVVDQDRHRKPNAAILSGICLICFFECVFASRALALSARTLLHSNHVWFL